MDDMLLLNTIVHFDAVIDAHRCGLRVDVTNFSTRGGCDGKSVTRSPNTCRVCSGIVSTSSE